MEENEEGDGLEVLMWGENNGKAEKLKKVIFLKWLDFFQQAFARHFQRSSVSATTLSALESTGIKRERSPNGHRCTGPNRLSRVEWVKHETLQMFAQISLSQSKCGGRTKWIEESFRRGNRHAFQSEIRERVHSGTPGLVVTLLRALNTGVNRV